VVIKLKSDFTYQARSVIYKKLNEVADILSCINVGITAALRVCHMDRSRYSVTYNIRASEDKQNRRFKLQNLKENLKALSSGAEIKGSIQARLWVYELYSYY
jgi:hypothetical protein